MARILVVDDNAPVRWTLATLLRSKGHQVEQAADGLEALSRFGAHPYDVVLMDVRLPSVDGLEACRRLRQESEVPILVLSTNPDPSLQDNALASGATAFIRKPLNIDGLLSWLSGTLSNGSHPGRLPVGRCVGAW